MSTKARSRLALTVLRLRLAFCRRVSRLATTGQPECSQIQEVTMPALMEFVACTLLRALPMSCKRLRFPLSPSHMAVSFPCQRQAHGRRLAQCLQ